MNRRHKDDMPIRRLINKITNWYLQHFLSLIMIPVTFIFFVVGIYGRVFSEEMETIEDDGILVFFEKQQGLYKDSFSRLDSLSCSKDSIKPPHKHLLILDRTLSTTNVIEDIFFKKYIINTLDTVFGVIDLTKIQTKDLFVLKIFEKILKMDSTNVDSLIYVTYDGRPDNLNDFITSKFEWNREKIRDFFISQKDSLFMTINKQETDFTEIFKKIDCIQDTNTVVTIVSDFYHEKKTITPLQIEKYMQNGNNRARQYNCIYIVPDGKEKKLISDNLINLITDKIHGTTPIIVPINSSDYFNSDDFFKLDKDLIQGFSPVHQRSNMEQIKVYYPRDNKVYLTAECKIVFCDTIAKDSCHYWKVINPFSHIDNEKFIYETIGKKKYESKVEINSPDWRSVFFSDTLKIKFPLSSIKPNSQYLLSVIHNNINIRYRIDFKEYIPLWISIVSLIMIYSIVFFLLLLVLCWTRIHYDTINTYIDDKNWKIKGHHPSRIEHNYYTINYLTKRNALITIITSLIFLGGIYCCYCKPCRWYEIGFTLIIFVLLVIQIFNFRAVCNFSKK